MNASATRFLYIPDPAYSDAPPQLAVLDLNPSSLGGAPNITNAAIVPAFVLANGRSAAVVSAQVSPSFRFLRVACVGLDNGLQDFNVLDGALLDDGQNGDAKAGDGIFTYNGFSASCCAEVGPRTVRIQAESLGSDGKRLATAVDIGGFEVRE